MDTPLLSTALTWASPSPVLHARDGTQGPVDTRQAPHSEPNPQPLRIIVSTCAYTIISYWTSKLQHFSVEDPVGHWLTAFTYSPQYCWQKSERLDILISF